MGMDNVSVSAVGCVCQQDQRVDLQPVAFASRVLQPPKRILAPECLGALWVIRALSLEPPTLGDGHAHDCP